MLTVWVRILSRFPESVLWVPTRSHADSEEKLDIRTIAYNQGFYVEMGAIFCYSNLYEPETLNGGGKTAG